MEPKVGARSAQTDRPRKNRLNSPGAIVSPAAPHVNGDFRGKRNLAAARRYLSGVEALAREGRLASDPRVLLEALAVLGRQETTISDLFRGQV